ncbi:MAG TPA: hypothetical protein VMV48_08615 [Gallionellaceae bacterium]|nr:hypothetical protein [Gallionellaceae bacterium]
MNLCYGILQQRAGFAKFAIGIARIGQPGKSWQGEQPLRQCREAIGGNAQQFQLGAGSQFLRQGLQPVACQHQLLQLRALAQFGG